MVEDGYELEFTGPHAACPHRPSSPHIHGHLTGPWRESVPKLLSPDRAGASWVHMMPSVLMPLEGFKAKPPRAAARGLGGAPARGFCPLAP